MSMLSLSRSVGSRRLAKANQSRRRSQLTIERLEERWTPATMIALTDANALVTFDTATPATLSAPIALSGLAGGETVLGVDFRPTDGLLYGVTNQNRLVTINSATGAATVVATLAADPTDASAPFTALNGTSFGVDVNPIVDRLRVVSDTNQNLRINLDTGRVFTDTDLNPGTPDVSAVAYLNNFAGATATTLYGLDASAERLVIINPPNNGTLATVGTNLGVGIDIGLNSGFDIVTTGGPSRTNTAYATTATNELISIDLVAGTATNLGAIGDGSIPLVGLAVIPAGTFNFSAEVTSVGETEGQATVTVTRTGGDLGAVSVDYTTTSGTATAGADFATTTGTLNFAPGELTQTFAVTIFDDFVAEGSESINVVLSNATGGAVVGADGSAVVTIRDNEAPTVVYYAVVDGTTLVQLDAGDTSLVTRTSTLLNLDVAGGETVVGIDVRPSTGIMYGLVVDGAIAQLVTINPRNGAIVNVGAPFAVTGTAFGFDFNPVADRLRIVSNTGMNLSVNPDDGVVTPQAPLNPLVPNVVAAAYTNSFAGAGSTTLYVIDSSTDALYIQSTPASGTLVLVGPLGVDASAITSFEISPFNNQAVASITVGGQQNLYSINLTTGTATFIGELPVTADVSGLTSVTINDVNYSPNERYVNQLYIDLLGRVAQPTGLNFYANALAQGSTREDIADVIVNSREARVLAVNDLYQRYLERNAQAAGLSFYSNLIDSGATYDQVVATILGSQEYYVLNGGTDSTFLAALYLDVLGRPIEVAEQTDLLADLQAGTTRTQIAFDLYTSEEARIVQVEELFDLYLGRLASELEEDDFVDDLLSGVRAEDLVIDLVITNEYFDQAQV
jgi:hypothetical protein